MNAFPKICLVILFCSASSLAYEIALTRIFSISLWYHFAFMIISIAMLGIGASGTALALSPRLKNLSSIGTYSLFLGISISVSYLVSNQIPFDPVKLSWSKMQILYIAIYYVLLSTPFFFMGLIIAAAFSSFGDKAGLLYGADLLGAGAGSIGVLYLMSFAGPEKAVFMISLTGLSAAFICGGRSVRTASSILMLTLAYLLFSGPDFIHLKMSPYKGLQIALKYPGAEHLKTYYSPYSRIDTFKSPSVRFAPGISLKYLGSLPEQVGFSADGGEINAITENRNRPSLDFIKYLPSSLPYEISADKDVLILDPKGGLQCLVAEYYGSPDPYKIENNPLLIKVINEDFKDFSGDMYSTRTHSGIGRSWLRYSNKKFAIIDIPMTGSAPSYSFGISEDYRFTVEAFREYFSHLKPEGFLSLNLFILPPLRIELRLLSSVVAAMEELGIKDAERHIAAIRSWGSICILAKKSPLSIEETKAVRNFSKDRRFDLIYYPGIREEESNIYVRMPSNEYFSAFRSILSPETREQFTDAYLFDIKPVHDENPFFHYFLKFKNIKEIYKLAGGKWQYFIEEGSILPFVFVQVLLLSVILIILPVMKYFKVKAEVKIEEMKYPGPSLEISLLPYFACLGIGFMFVEVSLIQKMILPLEHPPYAVATVLTSLLVSSGIGSLLSFRLPLLRRSAVTLVISLLIALYSIVLPVASDIVAPHSLQARITLVFLMLLPLGLLMGIPFPAGIRILSEKNRSLIPWAWAINGCFSVLAPIMTVMLAMITGFNAVLRLGAIAYLIAFFVLTGFLKKSTYPLN